MKILNRDIKLEGAWVYVVILLFAVAFIAVSVSFGIFEIEILPSQFYGALIGVVITAIITVLLLQGQTAKEEEHEKNVKVFEKKQEIYHTFLEKLQLIIQDGRITIGATQQDGSIDQSVDELKDIIFQLCYLQLHSKEETVSVILDHISRVISLLHNYNSGSVGSRQLELADFYSSLSVELSRMVAALRADLYGGEVCRPIEAKKMKSILEACNLSVATQPTDPVDSQRYFWSELCNQFRTLGYEVVKPLDLDARVYRYYEKKGLKEEDCNYGITFKLCNDNLGNTVEFHVQMGASYYYGFWLPEGRKNDAMKRYLATLNFKPNASESAFYKSGDSPHDIQFKKCDSAAYNRLRTPSLRSRLMYEIVNEMDNYIKPFVEKAKANEF